MPADTLLDVTPVVADLPPAERQQDQSAAPTPPEPAQQPTQTSKIEVDRNFFVSQEGSGTAVKPDTGKETGKRQSELVHMSDAVSIEMTTFLQRYVSNLVGIEDETMFSHTNRALDKIVRDELTTTEKDKEGKVVSRVFDPAKAEAFLESPRGWVVTMGLIEQRISQVQSALGIVVSHLPTSEREILLSNLRVVHTGIDQGPINKLVNDVVRPYMRKHKFILRTIVGSSAGGGAGYQFAGAEGAIVGAAIAPLVDITHHLGRPGLFLDVEQSAQAMQSLKADPNERAFIEQTMGIDLDDYDITTAENKIEVSPDAEGTTANPLELRDQLLSLIYTRQRFYSDLGFTPEEVDTLPEQFLYDNSRKFSDKLLDTTFDTKRRFITPTPHPEQLRVRYQDEVYKEFLQLGGATGTSAEQFTRYRQARQTVLLKYVGRLMQLGKENSHERYITAFGNKIEELEGTDTRQKAMKEHQDNKAALQGDMDRIFGREEIGDQNEGTTSGELGRDILPYVTDYRAFQEALTSFKAQFKDAKDTDIAAALAWRADILSNVANPDSIMARRNDLATRRKQFYIDMKDPVNLQNLANALTTGAGGKNPPAAGELIKSYMETQEASFAAEETALNNEQTSYQTDITTLNEIINKQKPLGDDQESSVNLNENFASLEKDYQDITNWGIADADLRTKTLAKLLEQINTAHAANPASGWTKEENGQPSHRNKLLHAMLEARAQEIAGKVPDRPLNQAAHNDLVNWNISPNQQRILTESQIMMLINQEYTRSGGTSGWDVAENTNAANIQKVQRAIKEAETLLFSRAQAYQLLRRTIGENISLEEETITGTKFDEEKDRLKIMRDLIENPGRVYSDMFEKFVPDIAKYTDQTQVTGTDDNYGKNEQTLGAEKGYYEIMDLVFDYQKRPDRNEYFGKLTKIVPPDKLRTMIDEHFGWGAPIGDVLAVLDAQISLGQISQWDLQSLFSDIVITLRDETSALL